MKGDELKELIIQGIKYIEYNYNGNIDFDLVVGIREFLFEQSARWYSERFPEAYRFDVGITRKKEDIYYSDDGIKYQFDDDMKLEKYSFDKGKKWESFVEKKQWSFHYTRPNKNGYSDYYYINEIDHFFTHCIYKYKIGKGCSFGDGTEKGINLIKKAIELDGQQSYA